MNRNELLSAIVRWEHACRDDKRLQERIKESILKKEDTREMLCKMFSRLDEGIYNIGGGVYQVMRDSYGNVDFKDLEVKEVAFE